MLLLPPAAAVLPGAGACCTAPLLP
jgi:hypothetical protein